jgi:hypothetical protein
MPAFAGRGAALASAKKEGIAKLLINPAEPCFKNFLLLGSMVVILIQVIKVF